MCTRYTRFFDSAVVTKTWLPTNPHIHQTFNPINKNYNGNPTAIIRTLAGAMRQTNSRQPRTIYTSGKLQID